MHIKIKNMHYILQCFGLFVVFLFLIHLFFIFEWIQLENQYCNGLRGLWIVFDTIFLVHYKIIKGGIRLNHLCQDFKEWKLNISDRGYDGWIGNDQFLIQLLDCRRDLLYKYIMLVWIPRIIIVLAFVLSSHRLIIATKIVSIVLNSIDHIHKVPYFDVHSMVKHLSGAEKFVIK